MLDSMKVDWESVSYHGFGRQVEAKGGRRKQALAFEKDPVAKKEEGSY